MVFRKEIGTTEICNHSRPQRPESSFLLIARNIAKYEALEHLSDTSGNLKPSTLTPKPMVIAYCTIFSVTFAVVLNAFIKDRSTAKSNGKAWLFMLVAALLWPVTLPFIISSKLRVDKLRSHAETSFAANLNASTAADI